MVEHPEAAAGPEEYATVTVVGIADDRFELLAPEAQQALVGADVVIGGRRHLDQWSAWTGTAAGEQAGGHAGEHGTAGPRLVAIGGDIEGLVDEVRRLVLGPPVSVCVLASGDPGFFGVLRSLLRAVDRRRIRVLPAPSSVSLAFARVGLPWDDAVVVSAHGRPLADATAVIRTAPKVAVLTSPENPPEAVGAALLRAGLGVDLAAVCSRLGAPDEEVRELTIAELATGRFDPLSVVVLVGPGGLPLVGWGPGTAWGLPLPQQLHRSDVITKPEVRSVVVGKLALPDRGILWDVGAGSGSVSVECALLRPSLTVFAVEEQQDDVARIGADALAMGAGVHVVAGRPPEILDSLPSPDRAFVGGGGIAVLRAVLERLVPGGRVVATYVALDRAAAAADLLGNLAQVGVDRGARLPDGSWSLEGRNPVFVAWGPGPEGRE